MHRGPAPKPGTTAPVAPEGRPRTLVVGARGGIGNACAERLRRGGHQVLGLDRDEVDITVAGGAERAVAEVRNRLGGVDCAVHAVGMSGRGLGDGPVSSCSDEAWHEVLRVNLESTFRFLRALLPELAGAGGGSIVVVGSVLGFSADRDFLTAAYAASKAAVGSLVRSAALEGAPDGVRVNLVAPALVDTPMASRAANDSGIRDRLPELQPLGGGLIAPSEVAEAVAFLLSDASGRVTGVSLPVDAGWTLR